MSVIEFAEKRYKECCDNDQHEDARYWAAYLDGAKAQMKGSRPTTNETEWTRVPAPIPAEQDRRDLCAILASNGLEVRIVRVKTTNRGTPKRYIEYRDSGLTKDKLEIPVTET